jgi:hypothetical protein
MNIVLREVVYVTFLSCNMSVIAHTNLQCLLEDQEGLFFEELCSWLHCLIRQIVTLITAFINCHVMNSGEVLHQLFLLNSDISFHQFDIPMLQLAESLVPDKFMET